MSENEIFILQKAMDEVTKGQKELLQWFNDFRLEISENYLKKDDCKDCQKKIVPDNITPKFWQTKSFEWLVKTGCILVTLLAMAAIGMNYFKEYLGVIK